MINAHIPHDEMTSFFAAKDKLAAGKTVLLKAKTGQIGIVKKMRVKTDSFQATMAEGTFTDKEFENFYSFDNPTDAINFLHQLPK